MDIFHWENVKKNLSNFQRTFSSLQNYLKTLAQYTQMQDHKWSIKDSVS
jgi:hypothetical protein